MGEDESKILSWYQGRRGSWQPLLLGSGSQADHSQSQIVIQNSYSSRAIPEHTFESPI